MKNEKRGGGGVWWGKHDAGDERGTRFWERHRHVRDVWCRYKSKKKAFSKHEKGYDSASIATALETLKKQCTIIRVLAHTQIKKIGYGQKKAHLFEIQVRKTLPIPISGMNAMLRSWYLVYAKGRCIWYMHGIRYMRMGYNWAKVPISGVRLTQNTNWSKDWKR